jgi:hypothetical protein
LVRRPFWVRIGSRDPASPVTAFLTKKEATDFVMSDLGPYDISAGKFDGEFVQDLNFMRAVSLGIITIPRDTALPIQIKLIYSIL